MFTADNARSLNTVASDERSKRLDERIQREVEDSIRSGLTYGHLRVYIEDWFFDSIEYELNQRGFHNVKVPQITLKGDVYFSWAEEEADD